LECCLDVARRAVLLAGNKRTPHHAPTAPILYADDHHGILRSLKLATGSTFDGGQSKHGKPFCLEAQTKALLHCLATQQPPSRPSKRLAGDRKRNKQDAAANTKHPNTQAHLWQNPPHEPLCLVCISQPKSNNAQPNVAPGIPSKL
jgi:hypothetical protein